MRRTVLTAVFSTFLLACAIPTAAAPLTVDYLDSVTGLEWADLTQTTNLSWNQVATVCPQDGITPCNGNIGSVEFTGSVWGTRSQARDLVVNATDLTGAQMADFFEIAAGSTWAPQFVALFTPTDLGGGTFIQGLTATALNATIAYGMSLGDFVSAASNDNVGDQLWLKSETHASLGVWLHRPAATAVPEPASLMLLATGIAGTMFRRYRRKS